MRRWGRMAAALLMGALVSIVLTGCIGPLATQDVVVAPPAVDPSCLVGTWTQTEGWQRLSFDDKSHSDLLLIAGGATLIISKDGSGKLTYPSTNSWHTKDTVTFQDVTVTFSGTATLTYSAVGGDWRQVSDFTKRTQSIVVGTQSQVSPGTANAIFEAKYLCSGNDLVISDQKTRYVYTRAG
jgi:hypothetical protein